MNKLLKHKRIIAFVLVFTLSFFVVTDYKQKETQAFDLIITPTILWTLGLLAVTTGVVLVNKEQVMDLGGKIADNITDWSKVFDNGKIKMNSYLFDTMVNTIASILNNEVAIRTEFGTVDLSLNGFGVWDSNYYSNSYGFENAYKNRQTQKLTFDVDTTQKNTIYLNSVAYNLPVGVDYVLYGLQYNRYFESDTPYVLFLYIPKSNTTTIPSSVTSYNSFVLKKSAELITTFPLDLGGAGIKVPTTLPYGEQTFKENFNPIPSKELPFDNSLSIPIPTDVPTDVAISTDMPLDKTNVFEKGGIHTVPNENVLEHEGTISDVPGAEIPESLSLWGWLKALLMSIINFLKAILNALVSTLVNLLTAIIDILKAIATTILEGIKALFVPTVAVSDLFGVPSGSGFGALVTLFNWDSIWNIQPQPYKFKTDMVMNDLSNSNNSKTWNIELNLFDNEVVKNNINVVRNVLSYSALLSVIYFIVNHFLPERSMD